MSREPLGNDRRNQDNAGMSPAGTLPLIGLMLLACSPERFVPVGDPSEPACTRDDQCGADGVCFFDECHDAGAFECRANESPLLRVSSLRVELGDVPTGETATATVSLESVGDCLLTVRGVGIKDGSSPGFSCSPCDFTSYPRVLAPTRTLDVRVDYASLVLGEALATLRVATDDLTAGSDGVVDIELHASYSGSPVLLLEPGEVNYGYVSFAGSASPRERTVRVTNQGTGVAALKIEFIYINPPTPVFAIPGELASVSPSAPLVLPPYDPTDPSTYIDVPVTFLPNTNANFEARLTVHAGATVVSDPVDVSARLVGSSLGPPVISVDPLQLEFRNPSGGALTSGTVAFRQVSITNSGQSELAVSLGLDSPSPDFSFSPSFVAPLPPGGGAVVSVFYSPTGPSDPANPGNPAAAAPGYLRIVSNDPNRVDTTVNLYGWAKSSATDDVLRVEMTFDNDASGWAANDFRNVDLVVESPLGFPCRKPEHTFTPDGNGGYVVGSTQDFCAQWSNTGLEGQAAWIPVGPFEEPERVLVYGVGPDQAEGGVFSVRASYVEDCANIPSGLVADLAGIGISALLGVLGAQIGVPVSVPPEQVSELIGANCWDHASSLVTVRIFINGAEVAAPSVRLQEKGDVVEVARIERQDGAFVVMP